MRTVILAPAVAVAALLAAPAAADPVELSLCVTDVDCTRLYTGDLVENGLEVRAETGGACLPDSAFAVCTPGLTSGSSWSGPISTNPTKRPWSATCGWQGSPGSRIDFRGELIPGPAPAGVTVTSMSLNCTLYVSGPSGTRTRVAAVTPWAGGLYAHTTDTSTSRGDRVWTCLSAGIRWSDGHYDAIASAGPGCGAADET